MVEARVERAEEEVVDERKAETISAVEAIVEKVFELFVEWDADERRGGTDVADGGPEALGEGLEGVWDEFGAELGPDDTSVGRGFRVPLDDG